jgi:hypothetical protein
MYLIAYITEPTQVKPVVRRLGLPSDLPAVGPARGPPLLELNQTPAFDLTDPGPVPAYEFGQTMSWWDSPPLSRASRRWRVDTACALPRVYSGMSASGYKRTLWSAAWSVCFTPESGHRRRVGAQLDECQS